MPIFGNKANKGGVWADMIMSPEQNRDWLIYKWRPEGEEAGSTNRENSIRYSSSLTVRQGEVAVFQYAGRGVSGGTQDYIEGYFSDTIKTANMPILAGIVGAAFGGGTPFAAQVYFINMAGVNQVQFGVPYFNMFDPRLPDHPVEVTVRGTITFKIVDYKNFVNLQALVDFDMTKFGNQIKNAVIDNVRNSMMDIMMKLGRPLAQIETYRREIKTILEADLMSNLLNVYGVTMVDLNLAAIELNKECPGYQKVASLTQVAAETQIELGAQGMRDQYNINMQSNAALAAANVENQAESMRINRDLTQQAQSGQIDQNLYAQRMQTDLGGMDLHRLRAQTEMVNATAAGMGNMGAGGAMGGGGGFNPGAMIAGMAMGGTVGQGMAGMMGNVFNQMNQNMPGNTPPPMPGAGAPPPMPGAGAAPPPMPGAAPAAPALQFAVSVDGQTYGPFDMNALAQMAAAGQINAQSMMWREGMASWQAAGSLPELAPLFGGAATPPPPPPVQ